MIFLFLIMFSSLAFVFSNLNKKLLILLSLETFFLSMVISHLLSESAPFKGGYLVFFLTTMMVVDSVFGLTVLVSCGRSGSTQVLSMNVF